MPDTVDHCRPHQWKSDNPVVLKGRFFKVERIHFKQIVWQIPKGFEVRSRTYQMAWSQVMLGWPHCGQDFSIFFSTSVPMFIIKPRFHLTRPMDRIHGAPSWNQEVPGLYVTQSSINAHCSTRSRSNLLSRVGFKYLMRAAGKQEPDLLPSTQPVMSSILRIA